MPRSVKAWHTFGAHLDSASCARADFLGFQPPLTRRRRSTGWICPAAGAVDRRSPLWIEVLLLWATRLMAKRANPGDVLGVEPMERLEANIRAALRRKPTHESKLAGTVRALTPHSSRLLEVISTTVDILVKRASFGRPLYAASVRAMAELDGKSSSGLLSKALLAEDSGGLPTLSAACFVEDGSLSPALAKVATSRHPHLAFAAEVARIARGECGGQHIAAIAPKIKESHRIALCVELFVPLLNRASLPIAIAPALEVLRDAERHLGRWLVFGEIATRAGDPRPLEEARERASTGPGTARAAWAFVAWALGGAPGSLTARPTVELVSRLSDRPSADRDPTFLYRLAEAKVPTTRPMLENLVRGPGLKTENGVRAAMYLARDHGRTDLVEALLDLASSVRHESLRGVAAAALYEVGSKEASLGMAEHLVQSRQLPTMAWGALLLAAKAGTLNRVMSESAFRRIQLGWVE